MTSLCMTTSSTSLTRKAAVGPDFDGDQNGGGDRFRGEGQETPGQHAGASAATSQKHSTGLGVSNLGLKSSSAASDL